MAERKPTHDQAQLQLQLYDLRREATLRQARDWYFQNYFVEKIEDATRIAPPGSQEGTNMAMVLSYWDQACALLNRGLLHEQPAHQSGRAVGVGKQSLQIRFEHAPSLAAQAARRRCRRAFLRS